MKGLSLKCRLSVDNIQAVQELRMMVALVQISYFGALI